MNETHSYEQLPSGKVIVRDYEAKQNVLREQHGYGLLDIGISYTFSNGNKIEELYFFKKRMVSRKTYEKARLKYSDIPPADPEIEDVSGEIVNMVVEERKKRRTISNQHKPNQEDAQKKDDFCVFLLDEGKHAEATEWIKNRDHTLGEMDWKQSKRLVGKLKDLGCKKVIACKIDICDDHHENTGHLMIELPKEKTSRKKIFREVDKLAENVGYDGPMDDGERYAYVKLD